MHVSEVTCVLMLPRPQHMIPSVLCVKQKEWALKCKHNINLQRLARYAHAQDDSCVARAVWQSLGPGLILHENSAQIRHMVHISQRVSNVPSHSATDCKKPLDSVLKYMTWSHMNSLTAFLMTFGLHRAFWGFFCRLCNEVLNLSRLSSPPDQKRILDGSLGFAAGVS